MNKIEVYKSYILINDYDFGDCVKLENYFRLYDEVYHRSYYNHIIYNDKTRQLFLPRGIDIFLVERLLNSTAVYINNCDEYFLNEPIGMKYKPRDDKQKTTLQFITGTDEFVRYKDSSQYLISLSTGSGKTYVSTAYFAISQLKPMVISYNLTDQWKERITEYSNIKEKEIYTIKGVESIRFLLRKSPQELNKKYKVYLATHGTIASLYNTGMEEVHNLFRHLGIGVKVIDEAHKNFENTCKIDYSSNTFKTIYLTASPARGDEKENRIFGLYFKNVPKIDLFDEDDKHTRYIALRYSSNPTLMEMNACMSGYGFNRNNYANYVVTKPNFYYMINIIFDLISRWQGKKLFYISSNEAIMAVYNYIMNNYNYQYYWDKVGIFTSINPNKKEALDKEIILTTSQSAGEGLDVPGLICAINLADPTKSEPLVIQKFGRIRLNGYFIDLIDEGFKTLNRYYYANLKVYNKYAVSSNDIYYNKDKIISGNETFRKKNAVTVDTLFRRPNTIGINDLFKKREA